MTAVLMFGNVTTAQRATWPSKNHSFTDLLPVLLIIQSSFSIYSISTSSFSDMPLLTLQTTLQNHTNGIVKTS
jgi:hypothetical protein